MLAQRDTRSIYLTPYKKYGARIKSRCEPLAPCMGGYWVYIFNTIQTIQRTTQVKVKLTLQSCAVWFVWCQSQSQPNPAVRLEVAHVVVCVHAHVPEDIHTRLTVGTGRGAWPKRTPRRPLLPRPHYDACLHQFEQHLQYFTVFAWKNTHVKRNYPI